MPVKNSNNTARLLLKEELPYFGIKSGVPNERYYRNPFISNLDDKWACAKVFSVNF